MLVEKHGVIRVVVFLHSVFNRPFRSQLRILRPKTARDRLAMRAIRTPFENRSKPLILQSMDRRDQSRAVQIRRLATPQIRRVVQSALICLVSFKISVFSVLSVPPNLALFRPIPPCALH